MTVKALQSQLNHFFHAYRVPHVNLHVDGNRGASTNQAVRKAKLCLGYKDKYADYHVDKKFEQRLLHPRSRRFLLVVQIQRGLRYRIHLRALARTTLGKKAIRVGLGLLGITESWGPNQGQALNRIIRAVGGVPGESWCGDFVAYCYRHAGSKAVNRYWASVPALGWISGLRKVQSPQEGDIFRLSWHHMGMFQKWADNGYFWSVEGNTIIPAGEGVGHKKRHRNTVGAWYRVTR